MPKIYLFPDTNLFVQCKALEEIDWSQWRTSEEVSLFVTRPVQAEIDRQKNSGNGRLSSRARRASAMFRKILQSEHKYVEVRSADPIVRVYLRQDLKRDESLADQLSFEERDDQLVAIVALFSKNHPSEEALLLTHDTGPMATSDMVGVKYWSIPDSWLLPPEGDEQEKRIKALQTEITRLRKAEPEITSQVTSDTLKDGCIEVYTALSEDEIKALVDGIALQVPPESNFGSRTPDTRRNQFAFALLQEEEEFIPSSDEAIEAYRSELYPAWLASCSEFLRKLHDHLNSEIRWPDVTVYLTNVGSRPAEDALVTFSARGNFQVMPPRYISEEEAAKPVPALSLPRPPSAPRGIWKKKHPRIGFFGTDFETIRATQQHLGDLRDYTLSRMPPLKRDPNDFYYVERPPLPVDSFGLTCEQWRHQDTAESFELTLHVEPSPATYAGALEIKVQASNMTDPLTVNHPVRITVMETSALETAKGLVNELVNGEHER